MFCTNVQTNFTKFGDINSKTNFLVTPIFDGYQKKFKMALKKTKNDFLRGVNMRKLHQLTYFIDRNNI